MKSTISIFLVVILFIGCKKEELELSSKIENELAKLAYYPSKDRQNDYVV